jgi:hypothetical protein
MEERMSQTTDREPIAPARSPEALDFQDRLQLLTHDVRLIELGVEALGEYYNGPEDNPVAIIMACRRLHGDIEAIADEVLPPMPEAERKRIKAVAGVDL